MSRTPAPSQKILRLPLPGGVEMILCRIPKPKGGFRMGARGFDNDEEPVHRVVIPDAYFLGKHPVTQAQYRAVASGVAALRERSDPSGTKGVRHPVENVTWHDANRFCAAMAQWVPPSALPSGYRLLCLPTEAEWEHACRAGTDTEHHSGDGEAALREAGWFSRNSGGTTHAVDDVMPDGRGPKANAFGLCHMHGNVWEWCHDVYDREAYRRRCDGDEDPGHAAREKEWESWHRAWASSPWVGRGRDKDGIVTEDDRGRVVRGGSWDYSAGWCRSARRDRGRPGVPIGILGFRVCLVPGPAGKDAA